MKHVNESGRSMVEMLGVLAIIGVLSVGGIAGYSKAMAKYKLNKTIDQVTMLVANIRTTFASASDYNGIKLSLLAQTGILPSEMYSSISSNMTATNPYAGDVEVKASKANATADTAFIITYKGIPREACHTLLTSDWGSDVGSGLVAVGTTEPGDAVLLGNAGTANSIGTPGGATQDLPFSVSEATAACNNDTNTIYWKYF